MYHPSDRLRMLGLISQIEDLRVELIMYHSDDRLRIISWKNTDLWGKSTGWMVAQSIEYQRAEFKT